MDSQYLLDKCREPCLQKLNCNDICLGTCGECKQGRLHIPCSKICNKINPCNHTCKFSCKERCPPCNQKCIYSCVHSRCTQVCGSPRVQCKAKCEWNCPHLKCTRKCYEICDRKPCYKPCMLKLICGHECIGFCGEPCPPLCRICQEDEFTTIVFDNEDVKNARFVYLVDCEHIIESETLTDWMNLNDEEICLKQCPLCKTPILKTQRFMNQVKVILEDISKIKIKQYGKVAAIRQKMKTIIDSLRALNKNFFSNYIGGYGYSSIKSLWDKFCEPLLRYSDKESNVFLPANDIESLTFVIDVFKTTSKYKHRINALNDSQKEQIIISHFYWILSVAFTYAQQLSNQQKFDINMEMARGARIMNLYEILSSSKFQKALVMDNSYAIRLKGLVRKMEALLMSCKIYTVDRDTKIKIITELIYKKFDGLAVITVKERQMIHAAMSTSFSRCIKAQGHWLKCRNGHFYCVMECGVPMKQSVCPECKV